MDDTVILVSVSSMILLIVAPLLIENGFSFKPHPVISYQSIMSNIQISSTFEDNDHLFSNYPSHEVVVSQNLEREVVRFPGVPRLILHHFDDLRTLDRYAHYNIFLLTFIFFFKTLRFTS